MRATLDPEHLRELLTAAESADMAGVARQEMVPATKSAQDASFSKFCGWRLFGSA